MPFTKKPNTEPIPGYRLLAPLGSGGYGEVWKCQAPGGLFKAIKFVYGNLDGAALQSTQAHEELRAIQCIKDLRHPFLLSIDRVECTGGELMIVTELADKNLHEVLVEHQQQGQPGLPRDELLGYLFEAAEVLDLMNSRHGLQHLDVKPRNLFLVSNHVKVADFGLVTSLAASGAGVQLGAVTPLYASPEVLLGKVSTTSDQYSLACTYMELLTGRLPFEGRNSRQLLLQHTQDPPNLMPLPEPERRMVGRALAKKPAQRYSSCVEFITALLDCSMPCLPPEAPAPFPRSEALVQTPDKLHQNDTDGRLRRTPGCRSAVAGYTFVENQGSSPLEDVWKVTAPDGQLRQLKLIYGFTGNADDSIRRLRALQHPALQPIEIVQSGPGCLVLVNKLPKETLRDRLAKCHSQKLLGIPRTELLGYLRTVAEAIDYLYQQHSLQHLGLNPRNLILDDDGLQIAEFGLAHLLWVPAGQAVARYAAPELGDSRIHPSADQFSLALIFQELLTGTHPLRGKLRLTPLGPRGPLIPDLGSLSPQDQKVIATALNADPASRWPSCVALVQALEEAGGAAVAVPPGDALSELVGSSEQVQLPRGMFAAPEELNRIIGDLIAQAGGGDRAPGLSEPPTLEGNTLHHKFRAGLPVGAARTQVDAFRKQCAGRPVQETDSTSMFQVDAPSSFWQSWTGRQAALEMHVELARQHALAATPIEVRVTITAIRCGKRSGQVLQELGIDLLEGLRTSLLTNSEKRTHDRLLWPHPLEVCPVEGDGSVGPPIRCRGKDISMSGIGFYLPSEVPTSQVVIRLPGAGRQALSVPATLVRARRCADGWYDVGALFRLAALRQSAPEMTTPR
jgi:serine/threonine protein kinase